jgi:hypothetical protein
MLGNAASAAHEWPDAKMLPSKKQVASSFLMCFIEYLDLIIRIVWSLALKAKEPTV